MEPLRELTEYDKVENALQALKKDMPSSVHVSLASEVASVYLPLLTFL